MRILVCEKRTKAGVEKNGWTRKRNGPDAQFAKATGKIGAGRGGGPGVERGGGVEDNEEKT